MAMNFLKKPFAEWSYHPGCEVTVQNGASDLHLSCTLLPFDMQSVIPFEGMLPCPCPTFWAAILSAELPFGYIELCAWILYSKHTMANTLRWHFA
jgi:hypothetical protein